MNKSVMPIHTPAHGGGWINRWIREAEQESRGESTVCDFNHVFTRRPATASEAHALCERLLADLVDNEADGR